MSEDSSSGPVPLFVPPGHFYSPVVAPKEAAQHLANLRSDKHSLPGVKIDLPSLRLLWNSLLPLMKQCDFPEHPTPGRMFHYHNDAYGYGDACMLAAMLRFITPKRFIEVGSGWSSACLLETIARYDLGTSVTFIEPHTELLKITIAGSPLRDQTSIIQSRVQDVSLDTFRQLDAGDILFIDSTHVAKTGSDVCHEIFEILPQLQSGVYVHFHDTFWPFEYPSQWAVDQNRSWNELYILRAFLMDNAGWRIVMFNDYIAKADAALIQDTFPSFLKNPGGALWLRRA
jgi:hypothetical protein